MPHLEAGKNSALLDSDHPVPSMFTIGSPGSSPAKSVGRAVEGGDEGEGEAAEIVATPPRGRSQTYVSPPSTTTSIAAAPNVIDMFKVGDLVEGRYKRGHKWYKGRVTGIDKGRQTLDLQVTLPTSPASQRKHFINRSPSRSSMRVVYACPLSTRDSAQTHAAPHVLLVVVNKLALSLEFYEIL